MSMYGWDRWKGLEMIVTVLENVRDKMKDRVTNGDLRPIGTAYYHVVYDEGFKRVERRNDNYEELSNSDIQSWSVDC